MLFKILAIQNSGDLYKIALEWVTIMHGLGECRPLAGLMGGTSGRMAQRDGVRFGIWVGKT